MKYLFALALLAGVGCKDKEIRVAKYAYANGLTWIQYADGTDGNYEFDIGKSSTAWLGISVKKARVYAVITSTNTWRKRK